MKPISDFTKKGTPPEVCLRLVLAIFAHGEPGQRVTLLQSISTSAQEWLGDIIEAAGGVLGPYTPAAKSLMATMHEAHGPRNRPAVRHKRAHQALQDRSGCHRTHMVATRPEQPRRHWRPNVRRHPQVTSRCCRARAC